MDRKPSTSGLAIASAATLLQIRLLGGFAVRVTGNPVPASLWRQRRAAAIVKLLALDPAHRLHREQLIEEIWPGLEPESAASNRRRRRHPGSGR
jgi:DNA-binding SARP family transcriptional activator